MCLQRGFPEGGAVNGAAQGPEHRAGDRGVHARRAAVCYRGIHEVRRPEPVPEVTHTRRGQYHGTQKGIKTTKVRCSYGTCPPILDRLNVV